jgi:PAS domain-containing protein
MAPESDGHGQAPRSLPLILARELAANLATPMFLLDEEGTLVFCNEAAEVMIGKTLAEVGEITGADLGQMLRIEYEDGRAMRRRDSPPGIAFMQQEPAHVRLVATPLGGGHKQTWEVTAYPLFGRTGEMHGVLTVFWEAKS